MIDYAKNNFMSEIMQEDPEKYYDTTKITVISVEKEQIISDILSNSYIVGTITCSYLTTCFLLYLSGDDLHYLVTIPYYKGYLVFGALTRSHHKNIAEIKPKIKQRKLIGVKD